jgi:tRNA(Ile)-lysidine synthase
MRPVNGPIIRPLVETDRAGVVAWLDAIGQEWREDPTNQDRRFARNRIRHDVLPMLARNSNPNLDATLARTIDLLEDEDVWMDQMAGQWLGPRVALDGPELVVRIDDLTTRGPAMVRRILRQALRMAGSGMENIGFDHIESVRSLLETGKSGRTIELPGAFSVERSFDTLRMVPDRPRVGDYEYELPIPGRIEVREIGRVFRATLVEPNAPKTDKPNANRVFVDGASLGPCVKIRNWKIGDSYEPDGLSASKLKMLFQKERIPRRKRLEWPVLVAETSIVWVASFPVSRDFVPNRRSRKIVEFEASRL